LEIATSFYKVENRGNILDKGIQIRAYIGDVVLKGRRLQDVEKVFIALVVKINKMGLKIKEKKTKFVIVSRKPYNENEYAKLCAYNFEIAKDYTYLGINLTKIN